MSRTRFFTGVALLILLGACGGEADVQVGVGVGVVSGSVSGNQFAAGVFDSGTDPLRIDGPADPAWVVLGLVDGEPIVIVVTEAGEVAAFEASRDASPVDLNLDAFPPGTPPALLQGPTGVLLLSPPSTSGSFLTHPIPLPTGGLVFVDEAGAVVVSAASGNRRLEVDALPDARPVLSSDGLVAVLSGPTDRYGHGVLGDAIEATQISLIDPAALEVVRTINSGPDEVFEGLAPIWADIDQDGVDELIATLSSRAGGARVVTYSETGVLTPVSDPIGQAFRWRHQLAVGPFGPGGDVEVVAVKTPHIGGILEFYARGTTDPVATPGEFRTHVLGSRNLDQALAVLDGAGQAMMIVPTQDQRSLVLVRRVAEGTDVAELVELPAQVATNIAGVVIEERAVVATALVDGTIYVWR